MKKHALRKGKKAAAFLLAAALVCGALPVSVLADDTGTATEETVTDSTESTDTADSTADTESSTVLYSGTSGTCVWQLDADGVLTIAPAADGAGTLADSAAAADVAWNAYRTAVKTVVIESGVSAGAKADYLFADMTALTTVTGLSELDLSGTGSISCLFMNCALLTAADVSGWNTASITDFRKTFYGCSALTALDVSGWDTSSARYTGRMFEGCSALTTLDVSGFNTSNITSMQYMFNDCSSLTALDVSGWDTSNTQKMNNLFGGCSALAAIDVSGWNTSLVTTMAHMFKDCASLTSVDVSGFDTSAVTAMQYMFRGCTSLTSIDASGFDTALVTNMQYVFKGCSALTTLNLSGWSTAGVTSMKYMFRQCKALRTVVLGSGFAFVGTDGYLPLPEDAAYGTGWWRDNSGNAYTDTSKIPNNTAATYTAVFAGTQTSDVSTSITSFYAVLSKTSYIYNGKTHKPSVKIRKADGTLLSSDCYTVTYSGNGKKIGSYTVKLKGTGDYSGTITLSYKVKPAKVTVKKVKSAAKKKLTVKWKKAGGGVSYQVYYRVNGTSKWKKTKVKAGKASVTLKKLESGKKYQVKVRACRTVNGKTYYGTWSKIKTVKVK